MKLPTPLIISEKEKLEEPTRVNTADLITNNIYLGSYDAVKDTQFLNENKITHILTLGTGMDIEVEGVQRLIIGILDEESQNILNYVTQCNEFIIDCLNNQGIILIHCMAGISRSATILAAYMIKKYGYSVEESLNKIREKRPCIQPNLGFLNQLQIFEQCNGTPSMNHAVYRRYLSGIMATEIQEKGFTNIKFEELECIDAKEKIRCKFCSFKQVISHDPSTGFVKPLKLGQNSNIVECTSFFVEPLSWINEDSGKWEVEAKIDCPKCNHKLGSYNWAGSQCSCGKWIVPAFMFNKSKVDSDPLRSQSYYK